jgi:hypothetical protein
MWCWICMCVKLFGDGFMLGVYQHDSHTHSLSLSLSLSTHAPPHTTFVHIHPLDLISNGIQESASSDVSFVSINAGWSHACGVTSTGSINCWGEDQLDIVPPTRFIRCHHLHLDLMLLLFPHLCF